MARWQPRYPPATVRPPLTCPTTGLARYASRRLAWLSPGWPIDLTPRQCTACHGWHLTDPTGGDNPMNPQNEMTTSLADAHDPTPLRWGLNDVMWGDDDSVIVLLSGPDGEPYWLELDAERAAVLRADLAGPAGETTDSP